MNSKSFVNIVPYFNDKIQFKHHRHVHSTYKDTYSNKIDTIIYHRKKKSNEKKKLN